MRRRRRALSVLVVAVIGLCIVAWLARGPLLEGAAQAWIVSDPVAPADAVAVLGGGIDVRPFAAAKYYQERLATKILIVDVRASPSVSLGAVPSHAELNRQVLLKLGVPVEAIESIGTGVRNSREEALALREWAERNRARGVIVPTEIFSSRRVRWALEQAFAGSAVRVQMPALDPPEYTRADWWRSEQGLITFQNEVLKYVYYRIKY